MVSQRMTKSKSLEERFWAKVNKDGPIPAHRPELGPCWIWTAYTDRGYGRITTSDRSERGYLKVAWAHQLSWDWHRETPRDGLFVCHQCDNRACVNPDHLFLGTPAENSADMVAKGRSHKPHGRWPADAYREGTSVRSQKLTEHHVMLIRHLRDRGVPQLELAKRFGVSQNHICRVYAGRPRNGVAA